MDQQWPVLGRLLCRRDSIYLILGRKSEAEKAKVSGFGGCRITLDYQFAGSRIYAGWRGSRDVVVEGGSGCTVIISERN